MNQSANPNARGLRAITRATIAHYDARAEEFCLGTQDHDVTQNITALLTAIKQSATAPAAPRILDFGCGPGRDLAQFIARGCRPTGLDGSRQLVNIARRRCACEVWLQDFLHLKLPRAHFHGVFANASMFHISMRELPRVLRELHCALAADGVLFASNPRGANQEGWHGGRYGCYHDWRQWRAVVCAAGFAKVTHYYRPTGKPRAQQPWLASVWRKINANDE